MKIKDLRESKSLTQEELAELLDVSRSTVSMWETGMVTPRRDKLIELTRLFNCTIDDLIGESSDAG